VFRQPGPTFPESRGRSSTRWLRRHPSGFEFNKYLQQRARRFATAVGQCPAQIPGTTLLDPIGRNDHDQLGTLFLASVGSRSAALFQQDRQAKPRRNTLIPHFRILCLSSGN